MKKPTHGTVVAYVALFFAMSGTAVAATGGTFLLGRPNAAGTSTSLANSGSGAVLSLSTRAGQAPLAVSSGAGKVRNLDADKIDGLDSSQLQRRTDSTCAGDGAVQGIAANGSMTCTGPSVSPDDLPALYAAVEPSVVVIECDGPSGTSIGSGFVFGRNVPSEAAAAGYTALILTNEHVVAACEAAPSSAFASQNGVRISSKLWNWDQTNDVAALVATTSLPSLRVAPAPPDIGAWAGALGAPLGIEGTLTTGIVSNIDVADDLLLSDVSITHGNSGGPLIDRNGNFLGFTEAMLSTGTAGADGESTNLIVAPDALCAKVLACPQHFWAGAALRRGGTSPAASPVAGSAGGKLGPLRGPPRHFL